MRIRFTNPAGRVSGQKMRVSVNNTVPGSGTCSTYTAPDQTASYGWDTEGRTTSLTYPGNTNSLTYAYDAMGHLTGMTDSITGATASATYGTAGEMDSLSFPGAGQSFTYNSLWQLTGDGTTQYVYPAGQNNGRISQSISGGQTVNYTYDSLNRLATAQATDGSWGNAYSYDGFGNLTAKTVTAGSAPSVRRVEARDPPSSNSRQFQFVGIASLVSPAFPVTRSPIPFLLPHQ